MPRTIDVFVFLFWWCLASIPVAIGVGKWFKYRNRKGAK